MKKRIVLGIESSCDETAVALVRSDGCLLGEIVHSQQDHKQWGGVVPEVAARAHVLTLPRLMHTLFAKTLLSMEQVDAVAATCGPGLIGGIIVGMSYGKALAVSSGKPFFAINHLVAHALSPRLIASCPFPYLLLLVSGGHCQLVRVSGVESYHLYGTTQDDAVGEAFDKIGRMLELPWPYAPHLEKIAQQGNPHALDLPRPMKGTRHCHFSFSGIKTAISRFIISLKISMTETQKADIAASFQHAIIDILCERTHNAMKEMVPHACSTEEKKQPLLVVAGGVAANDAIRRALRSLSKHNGFQCIIPPASLCTDNAAMVAWAACDDINHGGLDSPRRFDMPVPRPRWPLDETSYG